MAAYSFSSPSSRMTATMLIDLSRPNTCTGAGASGGRSGEVRGHRWWGGLPEAAAAAGKGWRRRQQRRRQFGRQAGCRPCQAGVLGPHLADAAAAEGEDDGHSVVVGIPQDALQQGRGEGGEEGSRRKQGVRGVKKGRQRGRPFPPCTPSSTPAPPHPALPHPTPRARRCCCPPAPAARARGRCVRWPRRAHLGPR